MRDEAFPDEDSSRGDDVAATRRDVVPVPVRTLQPGDVTDDGRTVLRVTPEVGGRLHVRFDDDDTLWRMNRESIVWIARPV